MGTIRLLHLCGYPMRVKMHGVGGNAAAASPCLYNHRHTRAYHQNLPGVIRGRSSARPRSDTTSLSASRRLRRLASRISSHWLNRQSHRRLPTRVTLINASPASPTTLVLRALVSLCSVVVFCVQVQKCLFICPIPYLTLSTSLTSAFGC